MADEEAPIVRAAKAMFEHFKTPEGQQEIRDARKSRGITVMVAPGFKEQAEALGLDPDEVIEDFKETVVPALEAEHKKNIN